MGGPADAIGKGPYVGGSSDDQKPQLTGRATPGEALGVLRGAAPHPHLVHLPFEILVQDRINDLPTAAAQVIRPIFGIAFEKLAVTLFVATLLPSTYSFIPAGPLTAARCIHWQ